MVEIKLFADNSFIAADSDRGHIAEFINVTRSTMRREVDLMTLFTHDSPHTWIRKLKYKKKCQKKR